MDKDQVIAAFTQAYTAANGKAPEIEAKGGWYSVDGGKNMRLAQLAEMTDQLSSAGKAEKPAKKAKAKAPAKTKQAKQSTPGFSVKAFWNEKLNQADANNTPVS